MANKTQSEFRHVPIVYVYLTVLLIAGAVVLGAIFTCIFPKLAFAIALPFIWYAVEKGN
jgi:hypothetical protein